MRSSWADDDGTAKDGLGGGNEGVEDFPIRLAVTDDDDDEVAPEEEVEEEGAVDDDGVSPARGDCGCDRGP